MTLPDRAYRAMRHRIGYGARGNAVLSERTAVQSGTRHRICIAALGMEIAYDKLRLRLHTVCVCVCVTP
eukprot:1108176-Rhodomonas_salina.1